MLLRFSSLVLVLAFATPACSSSGSDATFTPPPAAADGGAEGGACGSLAAAAAPVEVEVVAEAPPAAAGGALTDGTFVSTRAVLYVGPGGDVTVKESPVAVTIRIDGSTGEILREGVVRVATLATNGTTLTTTGTCPVSKVDEVEYTASSGTLLIHVKRGAGILVETFTRQ